MNFLMGDVLYSLHKMVDFWAAISIEIPNHHICAFNAALLGCVYHSVCRAHTWGIAQEYFQVAALFLRFIRGMLYSVSWR
jgi:hypothetical protein